jgi:LacI family transcriptional regulator
VIDCNNTFGRAIFRGVTRYANLQRRWLLFKDMDKVLDEHSKWPDLDGVIFAGVQFNVVSYGLENFRHVVHCSGGADPNACPVVAIDDIMAGEQAANHLLDCKFENFAFYGNRYYKVSEDRIEGFRRTLADRGHTMSLCPLDTPTISERVSHTYRPALIEWLRSLPKPVGIMAFDDTHADFIAEACMEAGIIVPDQVAIVGVNNDDLLCDSAWPPLSSIEADYTRVGYMAARLMDLMLSGQKLAPSERRVLLPALGVVQRQSTTTLAVKDENLADAVRYIREHACDPCSVGDVLRVIPVGRRWLERQFVTQLGRTPHEEIARVRIETAQRLLQRPELALQDIAYRCGFSELKTFYEAFRKGTGTTPANYRRLSIVGGLGKPLPAVTKRSTKA